MNNVNSDFQNDDRTVESWDMYAYSPIFSVSDHRSQLNDTFVFEHDADKQIIRKIL